MRIVPLSKSTGFRRSVSMTIRGAALRMPLRCRLGEVRTHQHGGWCAMRRAILRTRAQLTRRLARLQSGPLQSVRRGNPNAGEQKSDGTGRRWLYRPSQRISVKRFNPRRVKIHRSYTVGETARMCGAHKNTVRAWLRAGLQPIDQRRPVLIQGRQLASFLLTCRERRRQPCRAGELYCLRCRMPKAPAAGTADYLKVTPSSGNLMARCSDCGTRMFRRVSLCKLTAAAGHLQVALPQAQQRLTECADTSLNCDLEREPDAQPGE